MKLNVAINQNQAVALETTHTKNAVSINNKDVFFDAIEKGKNHFTVVINASTVDVFVLAFDAVQKKATLVVNGKKCTLTATDEMDVLLKQLGMDTSATKKMAELKAPMPGLVVKIEVAVGDEVKKDQAILILEAMKMENVLKAQSDGVVKSIDVKAGQAVEKNQVLLKFN